MKPEFVDNQAGNTMAQALRGHIEWLTENYRSPAEVSIATGFFNPEGYAAIAAPLEKVQRVRLLLGTEPITQSQERRRRLGEPRGRKFEEAVFREALAALEQGLRDNLNLLGFTEEMDALLRRLVAFLRSGRVEVRRYDKGFLHGKAFLFSTDEGVIAGSSNFTGAGLTTNLELNLGHYQPGLVRRVADWFENLWQGAAPYDLASLYEARYKEYPPYLIYLRMLLEKYGSELEEEAQAGGVIPLTTFQRDGLLRVRRMLEKYNGVIIADGVGLGKTFLAGEILREAVYDRRQRALLVSPASLRDGTWQSFAARFQLYLENLSFEEVAADPSLGGEGQPKLKDRPDRYSMIIVDEAHSLRNLDTKRRRAILRLLRGMPPKKLVLVTATPVNNSLWDLYNLITLFVGHDAVFAELGIPSLKGRFDRAMDEDPFDLKPDVLFDLLDQVVVRRTRNFVRRHYSNERIRLPDGSEATIRFPDPKVSKLSYEIDDALPGFFDEFAEALAPKKGDPRLTLARYMPSAYRKSGKEDASQQALAGLLRSALLKRFESSVHAFAETAEKMVRGHEKFIQALGKGRIVTSELLADWDEDVATDRDIEELLFEKGAESAEEYDLKRLRRDVEADRDLLDRLSKRARKLTRDLDPKLMKLTSALLDILREAEREGDTPEKKRDLCKVLIFSYYADTVSWIEGHLKGLFDKDRRFAHYRGRIAFTTGRDLPGGISREAAVFGFAPRSAEAPPGRDRDLYDIMIATDVLAEGLNLQQCRNIINYDLPWNPMRLVQRHGRIDRIGSPYEKVFIRCFFPAKRLDDFLELEDRLRKKIAHAAASIGLESSPLPGVRIKEDVVFADTRREIEELFEERPDLFQNAGEDPRAHSGEEYRQELRKGLERWGAELRALPWGSGSGLVGGWRGYLFCARVLERVFFRFVPSYGVEIVRDTLSCLKAGFCTEETQRKMEAPALAGIYEAWRRAREDIFREWQFATDPKNLAPRIRPLAREIADHLRRYPPEGLEQHEMEDILASVEAPWGTRIDRELRVVFNQNLAAVEKSSEIVEKVREIGLLPYRAPEALDPIDMDEVSLVCWLAVD